LHPGWWGKDAVLKRLSWAKGYGMEAREYIYMYPSTGEKCSFEVDEDVQTYPERGATQ